MIGGFKLSHKAIMRYAEIKGIPLYAEYDNTNGIDICVWGWHYFTKPAYERTEKDDGYFSEWDIFRNDWALIQTVEELGDAAGSRPGSLKIVEIPDEIEWEIVESDCGTEWVAEKHRTWN